MAVPADPSGSGKTTLLSVLGGMLPPTSGSVNIRGRAVTGLDAEELAQVRRENIGFVFQSYHLFPTLTAANIGDVSALRERAEVNEQDLGRIRLRQAVLARAGAFRGREFKGRVSSIARVVGLSRIKSGDPRKFSDVDVLKVLVELPNPRLLVVGEQVDVYFKSDRSDQVETQ